MRPRQLINTIVVGAAFITMIATGVARAQATLGFTVDPTEGRPGDTVNGQVSPADIAAHCVTDQTQFQARFTELFTGPFAGGGPEGELFDRFFPTGEFVFENTNQTAYSLTGFVVLGISANINGAAGTAFPQTFVMAFADIATQQPIGQLGRFDPTTGVGSVTVPDIPPGPAVIAATCVGPSLDIDTLAAGIERNGAFLTSIGAPADINSSEFGAFVEEFAGPGADLFTFLNLIGPTLIQSIVTFDAIGLAPFTVLEATPTDRIDDVLADIDALVMSGDLGRGPANGLEQHLEHALRDIDRGRTKQACSQLSAFVSQVNGKATGGVLPADAAADLTQQVEAIQSQLGCGGTGSPSGAFVD
jgi:hypothetical protein